MVVKNKIRSLFFGILIFSLLTVMVGGFLSFHLDHSLSEGQKYTTGQLNCEIHGSNGVNQDQDDADPCMQGFCHLGHCATLVISVRVFQTVTIDFEIPFYSKVQRAHERILDGPFQPPRFA